MRLWNTTLPLASGAMMALTLACGLTLSAPAAAQESGGEVDWEESPYMVQEGKVDYGTYNGFRRYHSFCHVCHGPDGMGSTYAPALKDSLKTMTYSDFLDVVVNGRQVERAGGQDSVMPSFAEAQDVMLYIDHIYAYLKARADDAVGRGRPKRIPADNDPVFQAWKESQ